MAALSPSNVAGATIFSYPAGVMASELFSAGASRLGEQAADLRRRVFLQPGDEPGPEHMLLAMIAESHELIGAILNSFSVDRHEFERALFDATLRTDAEQLAVSHASFERELQQSTAARQGKVVDEWDVVQAIFRADSPAIRAALSEINLTRQRVLTLLASDAMQVFALRYQQPAVARRGRAGAAILEQFGRDLTASAGRGELPDVLFREREVQETLETLCRHDQRNPLLIGEPGVGKTSVIHGLARSLLDTGTAGRLAGHALYQLNLASLMAGAVSREDLLQRVQNLIAACRREPVVLVVDDFARLFGRFEVGRTDAAVALLREALLRGEIQCIGECTPELYRQQLAADEELMGVCHPVRIEELTPEQTLELLARSAGRIEQFHRVQIAREAIAATVELGERFLPERRFPGKATSLLDAAAARVSLRVPAQKRVGAEDVAEIVSRLTGLDAAQLLASRVEDLGAVETLLKARIVGQDEAVRKIVDAVQVARSGLSLRPNRPDAVFLLAGPTGVGKTELAKALAEALQGSANKLIRFDMSEFMEKHAVAKLIGAPPGYIGYDEEAQLIKRVRANPRGVILFDEIEKAHPELNAIFLQIFDDGRLTDARGLTADFSQCVVLMTSNLGTREIDVALLEQMPEQQRQRYLREVCERAVKGFFAPEFLNRLDEVIYMNFLSPAVVSRIAENQLNRVLDQLVKRGRYAEVTTAAFDLLVADGYSPEYGARYLNRSIENLVLKPLAKFLLENPDCTKLRMDAQDGRIAILPQK
jgi:ATP-dependent Clp protease ATP-binding subunit ClpC